jgi:hypothetical protein
MGYTLYAIRYAQKLDFEPKFDKIPPQKVSWNHGTNKNIPCS